MIEQNSRAYVYHVFEQKQNFFVYDIVVVGVVGEFEQVHSLLIECSDVAIMLQGNLFLYCNSSYFASWVMVIIIEWWSYFQLKTIIDS